MRVVGLAGSFLTSKSSLEVVSRGRFSEASDADGTREGGRQTVVDEDDDVDDDDRFRIWKLSLWSQPRLCKFLVTSPAS